MRKHLFVTMLLLCGMPLCGAFTASADPIPQAQGQQTVTINGTVLDENNEPVIGASVVVAGTQAGGVMTDAFGHFAIRTQAGAKLQVSYVGYKAVSMAAAPDMVVYLQPTTEMLNELVAVGYGTQKRANLTGAVSTVDVARVMDSRSTADVLKALQGAVPGMTITSSNGDINGVSNIKIRGLGTLSNGQKSEPLIVVDGVVVSDLSFIDPADIQDISVLKDAASSAIYGTRAAFGVILITTKTPGNRDHVSLNYTNNFGWSAGTVIPDYPTVCEQLDALNQANRRSGGEIGLFGMDQLAMMKYAQAWYEQNGGKKAGYREMRPFQSWNDVGDYLMQPDGSAWYYADWDVKGIMFNNAAPSQRHNVSLEGTSGKTQYRLAFGYNGRQGIMTFNPDKLKRYNAVANISTEIFSWLRAGASFRFSEKDYTAPYNVRGDYGYMWRWGSYFGPYGYMIDPATGEQVDMRNDIAYRKQGFPTDDKATETRMTAWMEAALFPGFKLRGDFTYDVQNITTLNAYMPLYCYNSWGNITAPTYDACPKSWSDARQTSVKDNTWIMNVYGTYERTFGDGFNFKLMAGATAEKEEYIYLHNQRDIILDFTLPYLGLTSGGDQGTAMSISQTITRRATAGFFGRLNFDYKGIYLFEANLRYDGSSRFPANDQWALFPSFSAGYRFSEEPYFQPIAATGIFTNGKIRASYGHIGNEAVGSYRFISTISNGGKADWLTSYAVKPTMYNMPTLVSNTLSWERVVTTDIGLDLGFLNNSLTAGFDWYQRDTKDMLGPSSDLPATLGAGSPYMNNGQLRTRGVELSLSWNHSFGDADVYVTANFADSKTKVVRWLNDTGAIYSWQPDRISYYEGCTYGDIWGFETDRYFTQDDFTSKNADGSWVYAPGIASQVGMQSGSFVYGPGDIKFVDQNGDGVINAGDPNMTDENGNKIPTSTLRNHGDLKVIGNAMPRYEYALRIGGSWKGFDIDAYFQGVGKRDMWYTSAFVMPMTRGADALYANQTSYNSIEFNDANEIIKYNISQDNDFPVMYPGAGGSGRFSGLNAGCYNFYPQSRYLMNMAYLRFKTLTVGYTLPYDITKKALIQKARVYFSADNLCLLYNGNHKNPIDPEIETGGNGTMGNMNGNGQFGRTAPMLRTFSFGLQVTF